MNNNFLKDRSGLSPAESIKQLSSYAENMDEKYRFYNRIKARCNAAIGLSAAIVFGYIMLQPFMAGGVFNNLAGGVPFFKIAPVNRSVREQNFPEMVLKEMEDDFKNKH